MVVITSTLTSSCWPQICHMLRGGNMDFGEITEVPSAPLHQGLTGSAWEVVPWDVMALQCGQDLDADQATTTAPLLSLTPVPTGERATTIQVP